MKCIPRVPSASNYGAHAFIWYRSCLKWVVDRRVKYKRRIYSNHPASRDNIFFYVMMLMPESSDLAIFVLTDDRQTDRQTNRSALPQESARGV